MDKYSDGYYPGKWMEDILPTFAPLGDWVIVCKCVRGDDAGDGYRNLGGIIIDHLAADTSNFVELVAAGKGCKVFNGFTRKDWATGVGSSVWCPELSTDMQYLDGPYWAVREHLLLPVLFDNGYYCPLTDWIVAVPDSVDDGPIARADEFAVMGKIATVRKCGGECNHVKPTTRIVLPREFKKMRIQGEEVAVLRESDAQAIVCD